MALTALLLAALLLVFAALPLQAVDAIWVNPGSGGGGVRYDWGQSTDGGADNWDDGISPSGGAPTFWFLGVGNTTINPNPTNETDNAFYFNPTDAAVFNSANAGTSAGDIDQHDDIVIGLLHFTGGVDHKTFFEVIQDDLLILTGGAANSMNASTSGIGLLNTSSSVIALEQFIEVDPLFGGTSQTWRVDGSGSDPVGIILGRNGLANGGTIWADDDAGGNFTFSTSSGNVTSTGERQQQGNQSQGASTMIALTLDAVKSNDFFTFHRSIAATNSQTQDYYRGASEAGVTNDRFDIIKTGNGTVYFSANTTQNSNGGIRDFTVNAGTVNLNWSSDDLSANGTGGGGWATGTTANRTLTIGDGSGGVDADVVRTLRNQQIRDDHNVIINSSGALFLGGNITVQTAISSNYNPGAGNVTGTTSRDSFTVNATNITEVIRHLNMTGGRIGGATGSELVLVGNVTASDAASNRQTALIDTTTVALNEGGTARAVRFTVNDGGHAATDLEINSAIEGSQNTSGAASSLTKNGTGVLMFSGTGRNTYNGTTTVNQGTLALNKTGNGTNYAITRNLVVNNGATVRWDQSNQLNGPPAADGAAGQSNVRLTGGTLLFTNNTSEGSSGDTATAMNNGRGMGTLTLTGNNTISYIDFSAGGGSQIVHFAQSTATWATGALLHVLNWDGQQWNGNLQAAFALGAEGGNGTNQLIFGNSEDGLGAINDTFSQRTGTTGTTNVDQIKFIDPTINGQVYFGTYNAIILNTGEVVPYNVPEAGSVLISIGAVGLVAFGAARRARLKRAHRPVSGPPS